MSRTQLRVTILLIGFMVVVLDQTLFGTRDAFGLSAGERMLALCVIAVGVLFAFRLFGLGLRFRQRAKLPPSVGNATVRTEKHVASATLSQRTQWLLTILGIFSGGLLLIVLSSSVSDRHLHGTLLQTLLTLWLAGLSSRFAWLASGSWPMSRRALTQVASVVVVAAIWAGVILRVPSTTDAVVRTYSGTAAWFTSVIVAVVTVGAVFARFLANRKRE